MEQKAQDKLINNMKDKAGKAAAFCQASDIIKQLEDLTNNDIRGEHQLYAEAKKIQSDKEYAKANKETFLTNVKYFETGINLSFNDLNRLYKNPFMKENFGERMIKLMTFYAEVLNNCMVFKNMVR